MKHFDKILMLILNEKFIFRSFLHDIFLRQLINRIEASLPSLEIKFGYTSIPKISIEFASDVTQCDQHNLISPFEHNHCATMKQSVCLEKVNTVYLAAFRFLFGTSRSRSCGITHARMIVIGKLVILFFVLNFCHNWTEIKDCTLDLLFCFKNDAGAIKPIHCHRITKEVFRTRPGEFSIWKFFKLFNGVCCFCSYFRNELIFSYHRAVIQRNELCVRGVRICQRSSLSLVAVLNKINLHFWFYQLNTTGKR